MSDGEYLSGRADGFVSVLRHCLGELGVNDAETQRAAWVAERQDVVNSLRSLCTEYGDNDWSDNLHLADVIEKHLVRPLTRRSKT